jgi:hypothetical protein
MDKHRLTTKDNPFDPNIQFDEWNAWDQAAGWNTNAYLARVAFTSPELSDELNTQAIEDAIDEIVSENGGNYMKVLLTEPTDSQ